jgi:hypothetical protein
MGMYYGKMASVRFYDSDHHHHYQEKLFNFEHDYLHPEQNRKGIGAIWNVQGIPAFTGALW